MAGPVNEFYDALRGVIAEHPDMDNESMSINHDRLDNGRYYLDIYKDGSTVAIGHGDDEYTAGIRAVLDLYGVKL